MKAISVFVAVGLGISMSTVVFGVDLPAFSHSPPGELESNSGKGVADSHIYLDSMRFPLEEAPAFLNSQVYRKGGGQFGGSQCDPANYAYPWRDNFCETRSWTVGMCPSGKGHQGQDIRPATCKKSTYWAVAASDGIIAQVGTYSVTLQAPTGTAYRYLHLDMKNLAVKEGDRISRGEKIGKVSNDFGGASTTIHLHFDVKDTIAIGNRRMTTFVPPYTSLVHAYEKLLKGNP